jgi:hypothetical protein
MHAWTDVEAGLPHDIHIHEHSFKKSSEIHKYANKMSVCLTIYA